MSPRNSKQQLLAFCVSQYEAIRFRDSDGKHIAKGIILARDIIERATVQGSAAEYLENLKYSLLAEKELIRGSEDDDKYGWVLGGVQSVLNEVEKEIGNLG